MFRPPTHKQSQDMMQELNCVFHTKFALNHVRVPAQHRSFSIERTDRNDRRPQTYYRGKKVKRRKERQPPQHGTARDQKETGGQRIFHQ